MGPAIKWGVILAVVVSLVSFGLIASGLHKNPAIGGIVSILVFIVMNIAAVIVALRQTADRNGYLAQLGSGVVLGLVGGALILVTSYLTMSVLFPESIPQMVEANLDMMARSGMTPEQLDVQAERMQGVTPFSQAMQGGVGTVITSTVVAAITAIFARRK